MAPQKLEVHSYDIGFHLHAQRRSYWMLNDIYLLLIQKIIASFDLGQIMLTVLLDVVGLLSDLRNCYFHPTSLLIVLVIYSLSIQETVGYKNSNIHEIRVVSPDELFGKRVP